MKNARFCGGKLGVAARGLAAVVGLAVSGGALASVFVNGVNLDGVTTSQKFEHCTVTLDGKGNVLVDAPGYQIQTVNSDSPEAQNVPQPGTLTKKYFAVSEQSMPGLTQYDIDLYINAKWVRKFKSDDGQVVTEVTKFVHPGANQVLFVARKNVVGARKSSTPAATYTITVGEGDSNGDKLVIDNPLVTFKRSADQLEDASQEYAVTGR